MEMDHDEADFGDNFFGEEDEAPVDMEVVREGMKLVPLSDMCFGEPDDVIGVEPSIREHILSPLELILPEQMDFQESTKEDVGARGLELSRRKISGVGAGKGISKHVKAEINEKESGMEVVGGVTATAAKVAAEVAAHVVTGGVVAEAGPRPDFSLWTVEDDLMLKNAMEAGAAMEALAKGAMKFSHRYTVRELRERWRALLYDPEISEQAAARMVKAEASATNSARLTRLSRLKDPQESLRKRKLNSVRIHYYKMRKRIAAEKNSAHFLPSLDVEAVGFMPSKIPIDGICEEDNLKSFLVPSHLSTVSPADADQKEHLEPCIEESTFSQMVSLLAAGGVGAVVRALPTVNAGDLLHGNSAFMGFLTQDGADSQKVEAIAGLEISGHGDREKLEFSQHPNACVGLTMAAVASASTIIDMGGMIVTQDNLDSTDSVRTLTDSMMIHVVEDGYNKHLDEALDAGEGTNTEDARLEIADITLCTVGSQLQIVTNSAGDRIVHASNLSDAECHSDKVNDPSMVDDITVPDKPSTLRTPGLEHMICVLNTEDMDIPSPPPGSNEGIRSPSLLSLPYSPLELEGDENESSISGGGDEEADDFEISMHEPMLPVSEDKRNALRVAASSAGKNVFGKIEPTSDSPEGGAKYSVDTQDLTTSLQSGMLDELVQKNDKETAVSFGNVGIRINRSCGIVPTSRGSLNGKSCLEDLGGPADQLPNSNPAIAAFRENELALTSQMGVSGQSEQGLLAADQAAGILTTTKDEATLQGNYEECLESEEEMPSFSDVEAMILDMDLDPGDDEDFSARAESRRLYKKHRKTIVRLEQGANAALQRALSLRGAIAILYGHHLRYFITRNEVLLGRVTQDITVDIDLGKEGRANKVSRRQANIKLKEDGVFYLKNLGRRALTVNNNSIATGQRASLGSNCLIEVGGMKFIFEINKKLVRQRVEEMVFSRQHG